MFGTLNVEYMVPVEAWTVNWSYYDDIANMDVMTAASARNMKIVEATDLDINVANNLIFFRFNEDTCQREMRIVKMEGVEHPLEWLSFKITGHGIQLL